MTNAILLKIFEKSSNQIAFKKGRLLSDKNKLQPFKTGGLGNFPYFWEDPSSLAFNIKTFNWINANLKPNTFPYEQQLGSTFTNVFIECLANISFSLSSDDQNRLIKLSNDIELLQLQIVKTWNSIYSQNNPNEYFTIDQIFDVILNQWASPPVTFIQLQNSTKPEDLLTNAPIEANAIFPCLTDYLSLLRTSSKFINLVSLNAGMLEDALNAVQEPSLVNGAMKTTDGLRPMYTFSPSVKEIESKLNDSSKKTTLELEVIKNENGISINVDNNENFKGPLDDVIDIIKEGNNFEDLLNIAQGKLKVTAIFNGLCNVYFQPKEFNKSKFWYWMEPILKSIENKRTDHTGYHFFPTPNINFNDDGPFGHITGAMISKLPNFIIDLTVENLNDVDAFLQTWNIVKVYFLNQIIAEEYKVEQDTLQLMGKNTNAISLTLTPSEKTTSERTAYVQGVYVNYPANQNN
ncbi:hypothetical protein [uncultured Tenacibaculum sp.]|uniref:hypothetical protein n=1 Tax=uncultured Tenacibaculum sp. TaxID=174713 RepID=UPI00261EADCE|nr:hypothetical protein [uncultured Tenacibaculum sp.]